MNQGIITARYLNSERQILLCSVLYATLRYTAKKTKRRERGLEGEK